MGLPNQTIPGLRRDYKKMFGSDFKEYRAYVAKSLKEVITKLSDNWKDVGAKKVKLVFNKTESSISLDMDSFGDEQPDVWGTQRTIPFEPLDIDFFDEVTLYMKR